MPEVKDASSDQLPKIIGINLPNILSVNFPGSYSVTPIFDTTSPASSITWNFFTPSIPFQIYKHLDQHLPLWGMGPGV